MLSVVRLNSKYKGNIRIGPFILHVVLRIGHYHLIKMVE